MSRILRKVSRLVSGRPRTDGEARRRKRRQWLDSLPAVARLRHVPELAAEKIVRHLTREEIEREYAGDPFFRNYCLKLWEYTHGVDVLTTYPWNVALPLADLCNARCTFCTSWLAGRNVLTLEQFERYEEVLRHAFIVGLQGHGEPLANPNIDAILDRLVDILDPRVFCYLITNGVFLEKRLDRLVRAKVKTFNFSLSATTSKTHDIVMGLGPEAFEAVPAYDDLNPFGRAVPFDCRFIYQELLSTYLNFRIVPCCYMTGVPGHEPIIFDGERAFFEYWNSDAMVFLRRSLRNGPLLTDCKRCPMQG